MNKIQLIDAETLYYKPLAHPRMLIDGILADGLAMMAGDSKIGKSWMVLWLCLQISKGEPVWGIPTRKTDVVYLALEDREWRIQQRMQELTETPPEVIIASSIGLFLTAVTGKFLMSSTSFILSAFVMRLTFFRGSIPES